MKHHHTLSIALSVVTLGLSVLSPASSQEINSDRPPSVTLITPSPDPEESANFWQDFFPNGLTNNNGDEVSPSVLANKFVALYFLSLDCGCCIPVTKALLEFRKRYSDHFEVVLVDFDNSAEGQENYMAKYDMPWLATKWSDVTDSSPNETRNLAGHFGAWGTPSLVIFSPSGKRVYPDERADLTSQILSLLPEERMANWKGVIDNPPDKVKDNSTRLASLTKWWKREYERAQADYQASLSYQKTSDPTDWTQMLYDFYQSKRAAPDSEDPSASN